MKKSFKIYLGRNIPNSKIIVSDENFEEFLNDQTIFESFTIYEAKGFWKGELESVFIIEVFHTTLDNAQNFAQLYAERYDQEDVLINEITSTAQLLRGDING